MLVTYGGVGHVVPRAVSAVWLPNGQVLLAIERKEPGHPSQAYRLFNPLRARFTGSPIEDQLDLPVDPTTELVFLDGHRLLRWDLELTSRHVVNLPSRA